MIVDRDNLYIGGYIKYLFVHSFDKHVWLQSPLIHEQKSPFQVKVTGEVCSIVGINTLHSITKVDIVDIDE